MILKDKVKIKLQTIKTLMGAKWMTAGDHMTTGSWKQ